MTLSPNLNFAGVPPLAPPAAPVMTLDQMHAEIMRLIPAKCLANGQAINPSMAQDAYGYLWHHCPVLAQHATPEAKIPAMLALLQQHQLELSTGGTPVATAPAPVQTTLFAPANPVSDRTEPQQAQPAPAPAPAKEEESEDTFSADPWVDPLDKTTYRTLRGLKTHVTKSHKVDWAAFCATHGLDQKTGRASGAAPAPLPVQATLPINAPPASPALPQLTSAMPTPPATVQVAPIASPTLPSAAPAPATAPLPPTQAQLSTPLNPAMLGFQPEPEVKVLPQALPPAPAPSPTGVAVTRASIASMLGGEVDLVVVRLLDASQHDLSGRTDVNQLAHVAEKRAREEGKVLDLSDLAYGKGKQVAQRIFNDLLSQHKNLVLFLNGYEAVLPDGYFEALAARVTRLTQHTKEGVVTITF